MILDKLIIANVLSMSLDRLDDFLSGLTSEEKRYLLRLLLGRLDELEKSTEEK